jgi:hypothetical protein
MYWKFINVSQDIKKDEKQKLKMVCPLMNALCVGNR